MHIVHILPELEQGGVETVVLDLNRELIKAGHQCTVISNGGNMAELIKAGHQCTVISNGGNMAEQIEIDGGKHIRIDVCSKNPLTFLPRVRKLQTAISKLHPDILHTHSRIPAWLAWFANKKMQLPWITTVHGFNSVSKYSEIMTKGDRVICVSNPVKDYILKNYPVSPDVIRVIHGGIDPAVFDPSTVSEQSVRELKSRFGLEGKTVVSSIGRITELKDYETFIRALKLASEDNPEIRGLIVGHVREDKREYFQRLKQLIGELDLKDSVHIATDLNDMPAVYTVSDSVVSCSKKPESFGLTLIEALAMNTPVIATRHGGPLDIIQEGRNGFFFEPGSPEELADRILQVPAKAACIFRNDILREFNVGRMAEDNLFVYKEFRTG